MKLGNTSRLDRTQLQQRIIHLQSELASRESELKNYQQNYHYIHLENLNVENEQLKRKLIEKEEVIQMILDEQTNDNVNEQIKELKEKLMLVNDENKMIKEAVDQLEEEKEKLIAEIERLTDEQLTNRLNNELKKEEELWQQKFETLQEEMNVLQNKNEQLLQVIDKLEQENEESNDSWFKRNLQQQRYKIKTNSHVNHPKIKMGSEKDQATFLTLRKKDEDN